MVDLRDLLQTVEDNGVDAEEAYLFSIKDYNDLLFGGRLACGPPAEHMVPAIKSAPAPSAQASPAGLQVTPATHHSLTKLFRKRASLEPRNFTIRGHARVSYRERIMGLLRAALSHDARRRGAFLCDRGPALCSPDLHLRLFSGTRAS